MILNLCDLYQNELELNQLFVQFNEPVERVYIGSYFCSQYFLMLDYDHFLKKRSYQAFLITLVIPVITQKDLEIAKRKINRIIETNTVDEITVNDYGMYVYIQSTYPNIKINLGRLFNRDPRDLRVSDYYEGKVIPKLLSYDLPEVNMVEFDPTNLIVDFNHKDIPIAMHTPWCYMSYGNICKYASIHQEIEYKFRPNLHCQKECSKVIEVNLGGKYALVRMGRATYFNNANVEVINGIVQRWIYYPALEVYTLLGLELV